KSRHDRIRPGRLKHAPWRRVWKELVRRRKSVNPIPHRLRFVASRARASLSRHPGRPSSILECEVGHQSTTRPPQSVAQVHAPVREWLVLGCAAWEGRAPKSNWRSGITKYYERQIA